MLFTMRGALKLMRWTAAWMLMVAVLASGSSGMVLCIGDDGHLSVEPVHHRHEGHRHDDAVQTHEGNALSDAGCGSCDPGGCVDVPLGSDTLSHAPKPLTQNRLQKNCTSKDFSAEYAAVPYAEGSGPKLLAYGATPRLSHSILAQRTVLLRI